MRKTVMAMVGAAIFALCAVEEVSAHEGIGGEPAHSDMQDGVRIWHDHGPTPEERAARHKRLCEAARADMERRADAWNHREAAAWAKLQEACADESPVGQAQCKYHRRMYQANHSPAAAANFQEYLLGRIAEACAPPKSREEVQCEHFAREIERARDVRNANGIDYWTKRATEAGCT